MENRRYRGEEGEPRGGVRRRSQGRRRRDQEDGEQGIRENRRWSLQGSNTIRQIAIRGRSGSSSLDTSYLENQRYYTHSRVEPSTDNETEEEDYTDTDSQDTTESRRRRPRERRTAGRRRTTSRPRRSHSSQTFTVSPEHGRQRAQQNPRYSSETREESEAERGRARRRNVRGGRRGRYPSEPLANQLALAMHNLGLGANRKHPEPDKYKIESGESFSQFVGDFERYCYYAISENTEDWKKQLKNYLGGEMLEVYYDVKKGRQSYEDMIQELREYYKERKKSVKVDHKTEFHRADWKEGESIHRYAVRLEGLAREAYGRRYERVLRKKFLETAPENFISLLTVYGCARSKKFGLTVEELDWEEIISLAAKEKRRIGNTVEEKKSRKDLKNRKVETTDESEEEEMEEARAAIATQIPVRERQRNESSSRFVPNITGKISAVRAGQCFRCGELGHFVANCPQAPTECWTCGEYTHLARDCPMNWNQQQGRGQGYWSRGRTEQQNSNQVRYPQQGSDNQGDFGYGRQYQHEGQSKWSTNPGRGYRRNNQDSNNWGVNSPPGPQSWQPLPQRRGVGRWRGYPQDNRNNTGLGRGSVNPSSVRSGQSTTERAQELSGN